MENKKKKSAFLERLVSVLKSSVVRNIVIFIFLLLSVFCMLLLDEGNYIREEYMGSLTDNFIKTIMDKLHINSYNVGLESWVLLFSILGVASIFLLANMLSHFFVDDWAKSKEEKYGSEKRAKRFCTLYYYLIVLAVVAACVFIFFMAGGADAFRAGSVGVFLNLIYTILLFMLFCACGILLLCLLGLIVRGIIGFVTLLATGIRPAKTKADMLDGDLSANNGAGVASQVTPEALAASGKDLFPALTAIDLANAEGGEDFETDEVELNELALRFQSYAANNHKIYYELPLIRAFIAGLASSRLIILEGLSGTGKSMLPRMFSGFLSGNAFFSPVQATWRDKSDILGFYSEFTKTFKITDFLRDLYSASYSDKATMMVLDEMNISRIEYYFADFLSILEYPQDQWKVKAYEPELNQALPAKLTGGYVTVPANTWFIGTANTDDSTFTITDKVYDRAITLDFRERIEEVTSDYDSDPISLSAEKLQEMFVEAKENVENCLTKDEKEKFIRISTFIRDAFDIHFGNRIMVQIEQFVPVYVALGGTKEAALDFMLASKVLRKLDGMFEEYVKEELVSLTKMINTTYGKGVFVETERIIAKILKRLV